MSFVGVQRLGYINLPLSFSSGSHWSWLVHFKSRAWNNENLAGQSPIWEHMILWDHPEVWALRVTIAELLNVHVLIRNLLFGLICVAHFGGLGHYAQRSI